MSTPNKPLHVTMQDPEKLKMLSDILGITIPELLDLDPTIEMATNLYTHKDFTLLVFGKEIPADILSRFKLPVINGQFVHLPFNVLND